MPRIERLEDQEKLNGDINVTSPTGLKTLHDLSNINLAKIFWKELKA